MNRMLIGAVALLLVSGSAALAQPNNPDRQGNRDAGHHAGQDQNRGDQGGDRGRGDQGGGFNRGGDHHRGHMVCSWRHHHRVCYRRHW